MPMNQHHKETVYQIDADDRLVVFNSQWNRFAIENDARDLMQDHITNQVLWHFIRDSETRHLHQTLLQRVRQSGHTLTLPFRCDAPALRRYMEMIIAPLDNDAIEYCCRTLRTEQREPLRLLDPAASHNEHGAMLRMCSWCKNIDTGGTGWMETENAIAHLHLFDTESLPRITHTMCDACLGRFGFDNDH